MYVTSLANANERTGNYKSCPWGLQCSGIAPGQENQLAVFERKSWIRFLIGFHAPQNSFRDWISGDKRCALTGYKRQNISGAHRKVLRTVSFLPFRLCHYSFSGEDCPDICHHRWLFLEAPWTHVPTTEYLIRKAWKHRRLEGSASAVEMKNQVRHKLNGESSSFLFLVDEHRIPPICCLRGD